ncbi:exosome complex exonuclease RRP44-like [Acanthaster planci]|uniref:Protein DIS3 homolog n=1 Tax=Acanthaster planci TaxID=133434 RepID=A0A8B7YIT8_ACAPL|nr:exosome complex exonuclease RRP44-like [Acanthaster planci]
MLTSKSFVKKTKKGSVIKVVREHYLRDDIWCGSELCEICLQKSPILERHPQIDSDLCDFPHYVLPDTNVLLHQIDILEDNIIKNVVVLQTVQQEAKHRSLPVHKRMRDLIANADKKFYVFTNEHHRETYSERKPGETPNDYSDRLIRRAAKWYRDHLQLARRQESKVSSGEDRDVSIVLLTNDLSNRDKAREDGMLAYTVHEYVKSLTAKPELIDRLAQIASAERERKQRDADISTDGGRKVLFPEHMSTSQLQSAIKKGKIKQGTFHASSENFREGHVSIHGEEQMIFIKGLANQNRAVNGDVVAIEILPKQQWACPSSIVAVDNAKKEEEGEKDFEENESVSSQPTNSQPSGKVVGIVKRNWRPYCGVLQPSNNTEGTRHLFMAAEKKIPKIRIETRQAASLQGQRIIVSIDSWPRNSRYPMGHFVRLLGEIGDRDTENEVLLLEHDVPHQPFSEAVLSFLPKMPWGITEEDVKVREDLRHLDICSVDPPGCTDIDDALHCREISNGNLEVGVHIADVTHFIRPGNALDDEAFNRGTTVYLVDKRIDMVPELLSSNLCSLRGNEVRFAFTCIWEMTPKAEIVNTRFTKSIIRSRAAFTYEEAQLRIDDKSMNDSITLGLRGLNRLAKILKQKRLDNGALVLASPEIRFSMDSETHDPIEVQQKELRETNSMVEEFMLLANISVAKQIFEEFPQCACLRRHPTPAPSSYEPVIKAALAKGVKLEVDNGFALARSLDKAVLSDEPFFNTLLRMMTTRCMTQALYFSSGTLPYEDFFHYGLAAPIYTHFTSPIRRYSDILVHRALAVAIHADQSYPSLLDKQKVQTMCNHLNIRHRMAQYAGRASVALHTQIFLKEKVLDEEGYIIFVRKNAVQVFIPKYGFEGTLFLKGPDKDKDGIFHYNEEECTQSAGAVTLRGFDKVRVQISAETSNIQHQRLRLKLVEPKVPGFSVDPLPQTAEEAESQPPPSKKPRWKSS